MIFDDFLRKLQNLFPNIITKTSCKTFCTTLTYIIIITRHHYFTWSFKGGGLEKSLESISMALAPGGSTTLYLSFWPYTCTKSSNENIGLPRNGRKSTECTQLKPTVKVKQQNSSSQLRLTSVAGGWQKQVGGGAKGVVFWMRG